jgi:hypothetical protein
VVPAVEAFLVLGAAGFFGTLAFVAAGPVAFFGAAGFFLLLLLVVVALVVGTAVDEPGVTPVMKGSCGADAVV